MGLKQFLSKHFVVQERPHDVTGYFVDLSLSESNEMIKRALSDDDHHFIGRFGHTEMHSLYFQDLQEHHPLKLYPRQWKQWLAWNAGMFSNSFLGRRFFLKTMKEAIGDMDFLAAWHHRWAHVRRKFADAVKAAPKGKASESALLPKGNRLALRRKGPDGQQPGRTRGQAVRHKQEELPLLQVRDGRLGVRDDDDGDTDRAAERIDPGTLPRVAFRERAEAADGTPNALVRRRAGFLQGARKIAFLYGISDALYEMPNKNSRCLLYRGIIYRYQRLLNSVFCFVVFAIQSQKLFKVT